LSNRERSYGAQTPSDFKLTNIFKQD